MKYILILLTATALAFGGAAYASNNDDSNNDTGANAGGGGKVKNPWQPGSNDICTAFLPAGIDLDNCVELASNTSGKTYLCETAEDYTVFCPED